MRSVGAARRASPAAGGVAAAPMMPPSRRGGALLLLRRPASSSPSSSSSPRSLVTSNLRRGPRVTLMGRARGALAPCVIARPGRDAYGLGHRGFHTSAGARWAAAPTKGGGGPVGGKNANANKKGAGGDERPANAAAAAAAEKGGSRTSPASSKAEPAAEAVAPSSAAAVAAVNATDQGEQLSAEMEAALEAKEQSDAYDRWLEAIRKEVKRIEELVLDSKPPLLESSPTDKLARLQNLFLQSSVGEEIAQESREKENLITFAGEQAKPREMPYVLLDPEWYKTTSESERLRQVLEWRPFSSRVRAQAAADKEFVRDPFMNKSSAFKGKTVVESYRRKKLDEYLQQELVSKRIVEQDLEKNLFDDPTTVDEIKKSFRANLSMIGNIPNKEGTEEVLEPVVTMQDKYIRPPGFVSPAEALRSNEEKVKKDFAIAMSKAKKCIFCQPEAKRPKLDPMNVALLAMFMNPAGQIIARRHNGNCRRHQRKLATTIKRAKHMGIFSYKHGGFTIYSPFDEPPALDSEEEYDEDDEGSEAKLDLEYETEDESLWDSDSDEEGRGPVFAGQPEDEEFEDEEDSELVR